MINNSSSNSNREMTLRTPSFFSGHIVQLSRAKVIEWPSTVTHCDTDANLHLRSTDVLAHTIVFGSHQEDGVEIISGDRKSVV